MSLICHKAGMSVQMSEYKFTFMRSHGVWQLFIASLALHREKNLYKGQTCASWILGIKTSFRRRGTIKREKFQETQKAKEEEMLEIWQEHNKRPGFSLLWAEGMIE